MLVHKECYEKLIHDVEGSETETADALNNVLKLEDKLWRYMDLAKFISMMKSSTLYFHRLSILRIYLRVLMEC